MTDSDVKTSRTLMLGLAGGALWWAALPPLGLAPLAWIAPVPWLILVREEKLLGRRPYGALWLASFLSWLAAIQWLRLPHPAVYAGWLALAAYLAIYLPLFVGLSRVAVHRLRVPLWLAAPVVFIGLEWARAHVLSGFLMGSLAQTQYRWPHVIQISDLVGEYGVDFVIVAVAACVTSAAFRPRQWFALVPGVALLAATMFYGHARLRDAELRPSGEAAESIRIALIQGNSLADWKADAAKQRSIMDEYVGLSRQAVEKLRNLDGRPVDLVVWPETMFRSPLSSFDSKYRLPEGVTQSTAEIAAIGPHDLASLARELGTPLLVGIDRIHFIADELSVTNNPSYNAYNSSVLVDRDGRIVGTYDKVHLVMFGEYVPFASWFPALKRISSITGSAEPGAGPVVLEINDWFFAPNICYETTVPHVIRRQAATLVGGSVPPDVLVNLTNDAWYWGSSALDMHLACGVFRAVETRKPLVIAANGGISAWIDAGGRIRSQSPRQQPDVILADVERGRLSSYYVMLGDWFALGCLACCGALAIIGWRWRCNLAPENDHEVTKDTKKDKHQGAKNTNRH